MSTMRKKWTRRAGYLKKGIIFGNIHGMENFKRAIACDEIVTEDALYKNSVICMSETWVTENSKKRIKALREENDSFVSYADPARNANGKPCGGKPSGGIEISVKKSLGAKCVTSSKMHIGIRFSDVNVICAYYKPSLIRGPKEELETVFQDLITAIKSTPEQEQCVIGGDFNMEPGSDEFESLIELLEDEKFYMVSDGKTATYKTGSVFDHISVRVKTKVVEASHIK